MEPNEGIFPWLTIVRADLDYLTATPITPILPTPQEQADRAKFKVPNETTTPLEMPPLTDEELLLDGVFCRPHDRAALNAYCDYLRDQGKDERADFWAKKTPSDIIDYAARIPFFNFAAQMCGVPSALLSGGEGATYSSAKTAMSTFMGRRSTAH